jgi:hypothetical protein
MELPMRAVGKREGAVPSVLCPFVDGSPFLGWALGQQRGAIADVVS